MKKRTLIAVLCMALVLAMLTSAFAATSLSTGAHYHQYQLTARQFTGYNYVNPTYHQATYQATYVCTSCGSRMVLEETDPVAPHNDGFYCTICNHRIQSVSGEIMGVDDEHDC